MAGNERAKFLTDMRTMKHISKTADIQHITLF